MSFIGRSLNSQKWGSVGGVTATAPSFSVRTGRRISGDSESMVLRAGEGSRDGWAPAHFVRNETKAARAAVEALDHYMQKLASFKDKALELLEEAHRALSRLERAVSVSAAPELIVVACEIKVACHRGLHLFRTYGKYRYLGKLVAAATRSSVEAKFDTVIARLTAIMPLGKGPSFTNIGSAMPGAPAADGSGSLQRPPVGSPHSASASGASQEQLQQPRQTSYHSSGGGSAGVGAAAAKPKGSSTRRGSNDAAGTVLQHSPPDGGAGTVLSVVLRSTEAAKVTCISFVDPPLGVAASSCVWWAAGECLEFYSTSTQSTTSFAPRTEERAAITAIAVDGAGNIWSANSKGAVMMRQQRNWEQAFVERAFSSGVRCLATDADSDVVWAGDEAGRLAVFRFTDTSHGYSLECTATILPGRAGAGLKGNSSTALLDVKPKAVSRWHVLSCRSLKDHQGAAEGPIRAMLVRDDRAWVSGGRTDPWIALFDAVMGTQLDMWSCGAYGSCMAMTSMLTSDALTEAAAAAAVPALHQHPRSTAAELSSAGLDVPCSVPEDNFGEHPRSSWRLITGHESGQLLIWNAAADRLQPLVKVGEPGLSPVKALCVMEEQGLLAVVHANGDLALFLRPAHDSDWLMVPRVSAGAAGSLDGSVRSGLTGRMAKAFSGPHSSGGGAAAAAGGAAGERGSSAAGAAPAPSSLTTIKPRRVVLRSHRSLLAAAAACSSGVVTASVLGSIKLWPAEGLGKEAERCGLLPSVTQITRESSLSSRSVGGTRLVPATRTNSDSLISNARSPMDHPSNGILPSIHGAVSADTAAMVAAAAAAGIVQQQIGSHMPVTAGGYPQQLPLQQQQQQHGLQAQPVQEATSGMSLTSWQPNEVEQPHDATPQQQQQQQQQHVQQQQQSAELSRLSRKSEPGSSSPPPMSCPSNRYLQLQQQGSEPVSQFNSAPGNRSSRAAVHEQVTNPLVSKQQEEQRQRELAPLERRSAPLAIPSHGKPDDREAGAGTAMYARLAALHQLGELGPLSKALVGSPGGGRGGGSLKVGSSDSSLPAPPPGSLRDAPGWGPGSGPRYAAPRAPKAMREQSSNQRERRRSERRLSKGANIAWSTCQIIDASELKMQECIGGGAYGQVFLAEWMGTQVAAKQLLSFQNKAKDAVVRRKETAARTKIQEAHMDDTEANSDSSDSDTDSVDSVEEEVAAELKQLMDEVWVLGSLSHPSITRFCALCLDPPMIVMQYYPHGSLFDLLKRGRRGERRALHELTWSKRLDMLRDIASGMVFLHSRKPPIVHGDLRSPNLLLDLAIERDRPRFHVKIADFGLARMVGPTNNIAVSKVTNPRWSAPEVLRNSAVSLSADVFSFAIVMWEILTWQQPYEDMMSVQVLFSVMQNFRPEIPAESELPGKPGTTLPRYIALMERCWAEGEHDRPPFEQVLAELDDMRGVEVAQARLRGGDTPRSLPGSARGDNADTPPGSGYGGNTPMYASQPGSNASSTPNSGNKAPAGSHGVAGAAGMAAAATVAAAAAAAAGRMRPRGSLDGHACGGGYNNQRQPNIDSSGPMSHNHNAWAQAPQSEPSTPFATGRPGGSGSFSSASHGARWPPQQQQQQHGVDSPPSSAGGASAAAYQQYQQQHQQYQSQGVCQPGPVLGAASELSFAMRSPPTVLPGAGSSGGVSAGGSSSGMAAGAAGPGSPRVCRNPSRLGPARGSGAMPSAPCGVTHGVMMVMQQQQQPGSMDGWPDTNATSDAAAYTAHAEYAAGCSFRGGCSPAMVQQQQQRQLQQQQHQHQQLAASSSGDYSGGGAMYPGGQQQQQQAGHSRLGRQTWGTLEGPLESNSSGKLTPRGSQAGAAVDDALPPPSPIPERPYSPFSAVQQPADVALEGRPQSPFASRASQTGTEGDRAAAPPLTGRSSPFAGSAVQALPQEKLSSQAPPRPTSPFAAVQRQDEAGAEQQQQQQQHSGPHQQRQQQQVKSRTASAVLAAAAAAAAAAASQLRSARGSSGSQDLQAQRSLDDPVPRCQLSGNNSIARRSGSLGRSAASRQGTDDSVPSGYTPPGRPCSMASTPQRSASEQLIASAVPNAAAAGAGAAGATMHAADIQQQQLQPPPRPCSPFAAVQTPREPEVPAAAAASVPGAAAQSVQQQQQQQQPDQVWERPKSPFAAVQHDTQPVPVPVQPQDQLSAGWANGGSVGGGGFVPAKLDGPSPQSWGAGSSQGSCSVGVGFRAATAAVAAGGGAYAHGAGSSGRISPHQQAAQQQQQQQQLSAMEQLLAQQQQGQGQGQQHQGQSPQQMWRGPPSPFAGVNAAAVQGPIVAQQAKAVLSQLNSRSNSSSLVSAHDTPSVAQQQEQQDEQQQQQQQSQQEAAAVVEASGGSAGAPPGGSNAGDVSPTAGGAASRSSIPLQSLTFALRDNGSPQHLRKAAAAGAAGRSPGGNGSPSTSDSFVSGGSITFPSGLAAVESVVFPGSSKQPGRR